MSREMSGYKQEASKGIRMHEINYMYTTRLERREHATFVLANADSKTYYLS